MSQSMHAKLVPYSSIVGQSITLHNGIGEPVIAQIAVMAPAGPPPGESHEAFVTRIAKMIADKINDADEIEKLRRLLDSRDAFLVSRDMFSEYVSTLN